MEMSRLTRDGTAELVSRDQKFPGANWDRELFIFLVQLTTSRIGNLTRLILILWPYVTIHTYIVFLIFSYYNYMFLISMVLQVFSLFF